VAPSSGIGYGWRLLFDAPYLRFDSGERRRAQGPSAPSARGPTASACRWTWNRFSMTQGIPQGRVPQETDVSSLFSSKRTLNDTLLSVHRSAQGLSRQPDETLPYLNAWES
jgi:hypothetical protein